MPYALHQVAALVLALIAFGQAVFVGRLDADKYCVEPGLHHKPKQFRIIGQVDGSLCAERHPGFAFAPFDQSRQHLSLDMLLVADKVVVHEEDALAPAERVEAIQLGDNLRGGLGARAMTQQRGHVAKVAIEWAAARELNADGIVMLEICHAPKRDRGLVDIGVFRGAIDAASPTLFQVAQERRKS